MTIPECNIVASGRVDPRRVVSAISCGNGDQPYRSPSVRTRRQLGRHLTDAVWRRRRIESGIVFALEGIAESAKFIQVATERFGQEPLPTLVGTLPLFVTAVHVLKQVFHPEKLRLASHRRTNSLRRQGNAELTMHPVCREKLGPAGYAGGSAVKARSIKNLRRGEIIRRLEEGRYRERPTCKSYPRFHRSEAVVVPVFTIPHRDDLTLKYQRRSVDDERRLVARTTSAQQKTAGEWSAVLRAAGAVCSGPFDGRELVGDVRQQSHEAGALDRGADGMLAGGRATALPTADDLALPADELRKQLKILVIDEHRARTLAVDEDRVFPLGADRGLTAFAGRGATAASAAAATETHCSIQLSQANRRRSGTSCELRSVPKPKAGVKASGGGFRRFLVACGNHSSIGRLEALSLSNVRPGFVFRRVPEPPLAGSFPLSYSARRRAGANRPWGRPLNILR